MDLGWCTLASNCRKHGGQVLNVAPRVRDTGLHPRVEFKTDSINERSRRALLRIGAKEEGTLRNHMIVQDGRYRHSVFFSVIDSEWPQVKANLEAKLLQRQ